jgi:hypothetical protein
MATNQEVGRLRQMVFHGLRRSSACDKHAAGVGSSIIMSMQGWKSGEVLDITRSVNMEDQFDALRKLETGHAYTTHQTASRSSATVNKSGDCITGA